MTINCSEKCIYEDEGICTLNHVANSSGVSDNDCPYYKNKKHDNSLKGNNQNSTVSKLSPR